MTIHPRHISEFIVYQVSQQYDLSHRVVIKMERPLEGKHYIDLSAYIPIETNMFGERGVPNFAERKVMDFLRAIYTVVYLKKCFVYFIITKDFEMGIECSDRMYEEIAPCLCM